MDLFGLSLAVLLLFLCAIYTIHIYLTGFILTGFIYVDWFIVSEVLDTSNLDWKWVHALMSEFNQTNFLESKQHYVGCILNMLTCVHEVQRLSLSHPLLNHTLTNTNKYTHTCTLYFSYLFFSQAVPGTDGQFHGHVCELLGWVNQTVLWGKKKKKKMVGQSERST